MAKSKKAIAFILTLTGVALISVPFLSVIFLDLPGAVSKAYCPPAPSRGNWLAILITFTPILAGWILVIGANADGSKTTHIKRTVTWALLLSIASYATYLMLNFLTHFSRQ